MPPPPGRLYGGSRPGAAFRRLKARRQKTQQSRGFYSQIPV